MKSEFKIYETSGVDWQGRPWFVQLEKRQARCNCRPKYGVDIIRGVGDMREPNRWFKSEEEALEWAEYLMAKYHDGHLGEAREGDGYIMWTDWFRKNNANFPVK